MSGRSTHSTSRSSGHGSHGHEPTPPPHRPDPVPPPVQHQQQPGHPQNTGAEPPRHVPAPDAPDARNTRNTPNENAPDAPDAGDGGDGGPVDPREGWFKGGLRNVAQGGVESLGNRGVEYLGDKLFGPQDPDTEAGAEPGPGGFPETGETGEAGGTDEIGGPGAAGSEGYGLPAGGWGRGLGTVGHGPGHVTGAVPAGLGGSDAYAWARAQVEQAMEALPDAQHPSRDGLGGALDEAVEWALEKSGLIEMLEKVTGNLAELNAASEEWQAQAAAVRAVAAEVRNGALPLAEAWEGTASSSFGGHMGEVADALDQTADGMMQTAQIINSAAQECAMAEGMVVEIISEAIEALIVSLAAEAVIAVVTMGIGLIADALISEAEIAVFVARVARVSTQLAEKLEELLKALKELGSAVKAVRNIDTARKALSEVKNVKNAVEGIRALEEGEGLAAKAAQKADGMASDWMENRFRDALGIDGDDPVQRGDGTLKGTLKAAGQSSWAAAKEGLTSDVNKQALEQEFLHDTGLAHDPAPYRVDASRIETAFG